MELRLYERVALRCDFPEYKLQCGDVATLVDYAQHPEGKENGCVLEVFNAIGESIMVAVVPKSAVEPLRADEVIAVRPLVQSA